MEKAVKSKRQKIVVLALALCLFALSGDGLSSASAAQNPAFIGRYIGEEETRQGTRTLTVALRTTGVAIVINGLANSFNDERKRGRWELVGRSRNQVRVVTEDNNDEYEFTYSNDTLVGGRRDRRSGRVVNRMTLFRVSGDGDVEPTNIREMSISDNGSGEYAPAGQRQERLTGVSLIVNRAGRAEMTFQTAANRNLRFNGWVTRFDNNNIHVTLVGSDAGPVNGTAQISYESNRRINSISISGAQNTRRFTLNFDGRRGDGQPGQPGGGGRVMSLRERGTGFVQFGTTQREPLERASVDVYNNEEVEITLRRANNSVLRLGGRVERMGNGSMLVRLTNSGNADASGTADVQYREPNTIFSIRVNGTLDRRRVTAEFTRDENVRPLPDNQANLPIDWSQNGNGWLDFGNQPRITVSRVVVSIDRNERATIEFQDRSNRSYRFEGRLVSRDGNSLRINVTEFQSGGVDLRGRRTISGIADVTYGRNAINGINLSGRIGNERFYGDFDR